MKKAINFEEARFLQYEMLEEVDRFCRANGLTYYLTFGTLLGAVRHKGFIPWDDDIDIMFPEYDLEKFCDTFSSEKYKVVSANNDKSHNLVFPRLYNTQTYSVQGRIKTYGIGIDLYGIYGIPTQLYKHVDYINGFYKLWIIRRRLASLRKYSVKFGIWPSNKWDFNLLNRITLKSIQYQKKYSFENAKVCMIDTRPEMPFDKRLLGKPLELQFGKAKFFAPEKYEELLTLMYGDYMRLPPEDERKPYHEYYCYWVED